MPAPQGNNNVEKGKAWAGALRAALAQYEDKKAKIHKGEALRKVAEVVVSKALAGDKDAVKEIGDRLDGKAAQTVVGAGENGEHKLAHRIELVIVDAS